MNKKRGKKVFGRKPETIQVLNKLNRPPYKEILAVDDFTRKK